MSTVDGRRYSFTLEGSSMSVPEQVKFASLEEQIRQLRADLLDQQAKINGVAKLVTQPPEQVRRAIEDAISLRRSEVDEQFRHLFQDIRDIYWSKTP